MAPAWLVVCRDSPGRGRWIRPDALSRISRAALEARSTLFLLFEDRILICLQPGFSTWRRQEELLQRLERLIAGEAVTGAVLSPAQSLARHMDEILTHDGGFQQILRFQEGGDFLFGGASKAIPDSCLKFSSKSCRTLCVIGGVRDMHPSEVKALENAAAHFNLSTRIVSFGNKPELTSKYMKAVAAMDAAQCFEAAVCGCEGKVCPVHKDESHQAPLHIVYALEKGVNLADFISEPLAVSMLVDTFMSSHGKLSHARLTFISKKNEVLSLEKPCAKFLREENALSFLQEQYKIFAQQASLDKVLRYRVRGISFGPQREFRILHADETALPLAPLQARVVVTPGKVAPPVAVVLASAADAAWVRAAAAVASATVYERASLGTCSGAAAYASILNHEGLLAAAISRAHAGFACPTRKVTSLSPEKCPAPPHLTIPSPSSTRSPSMCSSTCSETTETTDLDVLGSLNTIDEGLEFQGAAAEETPEKKNKTSCVDLDEEQESELQEQVVPSTPPKRQSQNKEKKKSWVELDEEWELELQECEARSTTAKTDSEARPGEAASGDQPASSKKKSFADLFK
eukprot:TRINITY_DN65303_c0_g1_i1.p1 TRINITY_DN65303_c0_g1~~TRINITY_DN65303_c0_g1_i1.p1  ORF type:complete len:583 (-),score=129.76 TRINITY_DN65303_c0_g1_i1:161-1885(-)